MFLVKCKQLSICSKHNANLRIFQEDVRKNKEMYNNGCQEANDGLQLQEREPSPRKLWPEGPTGVLFKNFTEQSQNRKYHALH